MRGPRLISLARALAWSAGYGAVFMVAYAYANLSDVLALWPWASSPKTLLSELRIPIINLLTIGLADVLSRGASRSTPEYRRHAERAAATLLCTAGVKAWLAAREILALPHPSAAIRVGGVVTVVVGVGLAAWFARSVWAPPSQRQLLWTKFELAIAGVLLLAIVGLNLPFGL